MGTTSSKQSHSIREHTNIMKVSSALLAVSALAQEKKVPPRRPEQRLNRLNQFAEEWLNDNLYNLPSKDKWVSKFNKNADRMLTAFGRPQCGFFDPNMKPHGGPDPNPSLNHKGRPRSRRQADSENSEEQSYEGEDGTLERYDKSNPLVGIKQITTGYRKWAERFINECYGQRKYNFQINRMKKWFETLGKHYVATKN